MKAYKVTVFIIDFDEVGDDIPVEMENVRYPNHCLHPEIIDMQVADIGEWDDDHPLNKRDTCVQARERLEWSPAKTKTTPSEEGKDNDDE